MMVDGYDPKNCNYWHCNTAIANLNFKVEISNILYRKQIVTHSQKVWTWHVGHSIWKITYLPSPLWTNRHDFVQDRCIIYSFTVLSFTVSCMMRGCSSTSSRFLVHLLAHFKEIKLRLSSLQISSACSQMDLSSTFSMWQRIL